MPDGLIATEACELLFELESRDSGHLQLGRFLQGANSGRLVLLRPVEPERVEASLARVEASRSIAHPKLGKVVGFVDVNEQRYVASEYIEGCTLSELISAARESGFAIEPAIASRIVLDALQAVVVGRNLLEARDAPAEGRCFHADAVWIAEFGETFLLEVGIVHHGARAAPKLRLPQSGTAPPGPDELEELNGEDGDVIAAGAALVELLGGKPGALERIATRALAQNRALAFDGPEAMARALAELPPELLASEAEVSGTLSGVLGQSFERRRVKLDMLKRAWVSPFSDPDGKEESTQFFQASELLLTREEETVRPPALEAWAGDEGLPSSRALGLGSDDETRIFRTTTGGELVAEESPEVVLEDAAGAGSSSAPPPYAPSSSSRPPGAALASSRPTLVGAPTSHRQLAMIFALAFVLGIIVDRLHASLTVTPPCKDDLWPSMLHVKNR